MTIPEGKNTLSRSPHDERVNKEEILTRKPRMKGEATCNAINTENLNLNRNLKLNRNKRKMEERKEKVWVRNPDRLRVSNRRVS